MCNFLEKIKYKFLTYGKQLCEKLISVENWLMLWILQVIAVKQKAKFYVKFW